MSELEERGVLRRMNAGIGASVFNISSNSGQPSTSQPTCSQIEDLKEFIRKQNEVIISELAEVKVIVRQLLSTKKSVEHISKMFPLKLNALDKFEDEIENFNEDELVTTIQKIIERGRICKNLNNLLSADVILNYNYDGLQQKKPFKSLTAINNIFYKATAKDTCTRENYIREIKKGFKIHKNKLHKIKCLKKKENTN